MTRWKLATGVLAGAAMIALASVFVPAVRGQERSSNRLPETAFRYLQWSGSQIGVTVRDQESGSGVVVDDVREGSPAEKGGIREKDVIVEFDGEHVRSARQFTRLVDETPVGRAVKMTVQRGGQRVTLDVRPEARQFGRVTPAPLPLERFRTPAIPEFPEMRGFDRRLLPEIEAFSSRNGRLGVQIEDVQDQLADYFGVKRGALVTSVAADTPAARAGFKAGDVITKINGDEVQDTSDVRRALRRIESGKEFQVDVVRERKPQSFKVTLDPPVSTTKRFGTPA